MPFADRLRFARRPVQRIAAAVIIVVGIGLVVRAGARRDVVVVELVGARRRRP